MLQAPDPSQKEGQSWESLGQTGWDRWWGVGAGRAEPSLGWEWLSFQADGTFGFTHFLDRETPRL